MQKRIAVALDFKEGLWRARLGKEEICSKSLDGLKNGLAHHFQKTGLRGNVEVTVSYDWQKLPQWLWQYQSYYFERVWSLQV
ncbi:DUF5395 family protein [Dissulfuribacter thermophilus]|uniref:DUF5395 family protein n=1 Tax=Dissulfuribacter thermophilus TaxID=1156395 RepID=UPI0008348E17|nr:DUF5395 family protein [Dissulfuribacter thermophilus]